MKNKKENKTVKSEKELNHKIYLLAHRTLSYKDAVQFIRLSTRKCE